MSVFALCHNPCQENIVRFLYAKTFNTRYSFWWFWNQAMANVARTTPKAICKSG